MKWLLALLLLSACGDEDKRVREGRAAWNKVVGDKYDHDMTACHNLCVPNGVLKFGYSTYDKDPECECIHPVMVSIDGGH